MIISNDQTIEISNLELKTIIGVLEEEKKTPQTLIIDLKITFDAQKAAKSDKIEDTIDYFAITKLIKSEVEKTSFELLEKLSNFILTLLKNSTKAKKITLKIQKPQALEEFGAMLSLVSQAG